MAIKLRIGRLTLNHNVQLEDFVVQAIEQLSLSLLDIKSPHAIIPATLPLHHSDPFDRLLIAQAMHEKMSIVSIDAKFDLYEVQRIW